MKNIVFTFVLFLTFGLSTFAFNPEPTDCKEILAVNFENKNVKGFEAAKIDKRLHVLMIAKRLKTAAASTIYKGENQTVYLTLHTLQEIDGESVYSVKVNGKLIGEVVNTKIYNTQIKDYTVEKHTLNTKKILLKKGDVIQVEFTNATNGFVPEGSLTATARGRWKSLQICK
ncbi:hypothetical protein FHR24_002642 [Wenyingzhuangia heitensis]|uniref:Uncharacterized protein n=1 Tax=Wenyingzhuangia heitensis TaxID=1487859 RepID=A0ABX0UCU4_9FLAO|nr:hypothetical protein [Wenyingzhuangia heitensis]NIJ46164.1 hypothetical protein [Wenyingzhuangia heitensis]